MASRGRRLAAGALVTLTAIVAAIVVGVVTMLLLRLTVEDTTGWGDLAAVVSGMVIGLGAAVVAWGIALVVAVRRLAPAGQRLRLALLPTALAGVAVVLVLVTWQAAASSADVPGGILFGTGAVLLLVAAPLGLGLAREPATGQSATGQSPPSTQPSGSANP